MPPPMGALRPLSRHPKATLHQQDALVQVQASQHAPLLRGPFKPPAHNPKLAAASFDRPPQEACALGFLIANGQDAALNLQAEPRPEPS